MLPELSDREIQMRLKAKERLAMTKWIDFGKLTGNKDAKTPSPNQIFAIKGHSRLQGIEKGRQEGQSLGYSVDSVLRAMTEPASNNVHVSTDKWESEKKQKYCLRTLDCMVNAAKEGVRIVAEAKNHIELETKDEHGIRSISSIDFLACRPPRGADKASVYLHEGAHMPNIEEILKASIGCTAHGGYIRMCGTHQGSETLFYAVITNKEDENGRTPYQNWEIGHFPWWTFPPFCNDVPRAMEEAWQMSTEERVEKFGTWVLKDLFHSHPLDQFQEEFECVVLDAKHSFFSDILIKTCQPQTEAAINSMWFEAVTCLGEDYDPIAPALELVDLLRSIISTGAMPGEWMWSADIGRKKDTTEVTIGQKIFSANVMVPRVIITLERMPWPKQEQFFRHMLNVIPVTKGFMDATGMGNFLAEVLHGDYGQKCMPLIFTNALKAEMANGLKIRMQKLGILIPVFEPLTRQIHAIKKKVTAANNAVFDVEASNNHHGDKFWSLAMFCLLEEPVDINSGSFMPEVINRNPDSFQRILTPTALAAEPPRGIIRSWQGGANRHRRESTYGRR